VSAAHQMRHVLLLDAGPISQRKGRAYWSKSVEIQDAPFFAGITGPKLVAALRDWVAAQPVRQVTIAGRSRPAGIQYQPAYVLRVTRAEPPTGVRAPAGYLFAIEASLEALPRRQAEAAATRRFFARSLVVASGFEDTWPDIEVDESATRLYQRHRTLFRFAGNRRGWHVCIRCDGHLHVDEHLAVLAVGDYAWYAARGAQDFTDRVTVLTNGRPHGLSDERLAVFRERGIGIEQERIVAHVGKGTDLQGLRLADGRELYFDGFLLDEGQTPNTGYLQEADGWRLKTDGEGQLYVDEDGQVLDSDDCPVPGLFAAGDIVADQRNLIATALGLGQNAGLAASDLMREW
jgi:thioredoxin reductase